MTGVTIYASPFPATTARNLIQVHHLKEDCVTLVDGHLSSSCYCFLPCWKL